MLEDLLPCKTTLAVTNTITVKVANTRLSQEAAHGVPSNYINYINFNVINKLGKNMFREFS